ncbi:chemotaxis protein CheW [Silvanigrella aquatica]|uniref:histidine kinase n=1 Tax=Silvanigrella aquatica TaxID=1915309 RepID=A0A1L4CYW0_9BACT|nr:chemotaxis protein CheW [Silvanigrella aquatica]APJ03132.1 hypothetical protein AXG55_04105 [Silvanigrella aquatica]
MTSLSKKESALNEYFDECQEMVDRMSKNVDITEKVGFDKEIFAAIYRDMHTIKGTSQLFGFSKIGAVAHVMETCLDPIRKGKLAVSSAILESLYFGIDFIAVSLNEIREHHKESESNDNLLRLLGKFIDTIESSLTGLMQLSKDKSILSEEFNYQNLNLENHSEGNTAVVDDKNKDQESPAFEIFERPSAAAQNPAAASAVKTSLPSISQAAPVKIDPNPSNQDNAKKNVQEEQVSETIRVQVTLLNSLMNLVGELVLIRNQLLQHAKLNDEDSEFLKISQRLNVLTAELQNEVMKTRMQPIGNILTIFSRVVRDLCRELGKKIDLVLHGVETELDKTVIEAVKDPLMHIVRNAVDHGIESLEERRKAGKKEAAQITINAFNESGQVIIEIKDDGRGLDRDKIGNKAVEKGLITKDALDKMSDKEVQLLIFSPGFSTAATVSNISGRGVGMDVVKTNVERIGGLVDIYSEVGIGTTIIIKIPLSLAIVPALIVQACGQKFAIPQSKLVELLRIDSSDSSSDKIESLHGKLILRLRGKLLPIISLSEILFVNNKNIHSSKAEVLHKNSENVSNVVVLNADNFLFGLIIDEIDDSADIVVKSLTSFLKDLKVYSGATIMGDGAVALTIDVLGIAENAKISAENTSERKSEIIKNNSSSNYHSDVCEYLLIDIGAPSTYAIPLSIVNRLEEFENSRFEYSGDQKVIRYRDSLLPIFSLSHYLNLSIMNKNEIHKERTSVVVIKRGDFYYGIEVNEIFDIIAIYAQIERTVKDRHGILGTIAANDKIIVVCDIFGMIDVLKGKLSHDDNFSEQEKPSDKKVVRPNYRILLAEDSSFFRNYVKNIIQESGYQVETAYDGYNAFEILENNAETYFSIVLSDIEMPVLDGHGLARKIRASQKFKHLPLIAITTKFSQKDREEGEQSGFNSYLEKLNADILLEELDNTILRLKNKKE